MKKDIGTMSREELISLRGEIDKALKSLETRRKAEAKKAAERAAKEFGFSLDDLTAGGGGSKSKSPPKYANPADKSQTWTGRGRRPGWVTDALNSGKSLDDMLI